MGRLAVALIAGFVFQASAPAAKPRVLGVSHVGIQVTDLAKARAFYGTLLGYEERASDDRAHRVIFAVNGRQRLIVTDGLPADRDERFIDVAFQVEQIDETRRYLESRGIAASPPTTDFAAGGRLTEVKDPDGHSVRFIESREETWQAGQPDRRISSRILHAGLTVKDAAAADRFYKDALGFSELWRGGRPDGVTNWINMRVPDGTDYLEYMLYPDAPPERRQLGSAHHVALLVPDMQQALETVRARTSPGDPNHRVTPQLGVNRRWQLNVFDPDGTRIEFMEPWAIK